MTTQPSADGGLQADTKLRAWYLRRLRPKRALAVREGGISPAQAAAFDQTMRELLRLPRRDPLPFSARAPLRRP